MSCPSALLFVATLLSASGSMLRGQLQVEGETCSTLKNQGSYFSIPVCVGTPPQCFDLVADTGSDAVIVPSCICGDTPGAGCKASDKCFRGTNKSSTFSIAKRAKMVSITFGSGTIKSVTANDVVSVGDFKVTMEDGVLLMVNKAGLKFAGHFEGILGLGIPKDKAVMASMVQELVQAGHGHHVSGDQEQSDPWRKALCSLMPKLCADDQSPFNRPGGGTPDVPIPTHPGQGQHGGGGSAKVQYETKLFLEQARVNRFSMCFRDGGQTGSLRLGLSLLPSPIQNIGKLHWGLSFQGISVGPHSASAPAETIFCGPETMKRGMETPCAIIPDSGTNLLLGPKKQISSLEAGICSKWERCQKDSKGIPSSRAFRHLLFTCGDWLTEEKGLLEIPSFFFHVKSGDGKPEAFELTAWSWVTETSMRRMDGSIKKYCKSSMKPIEYFTQKHGAVWIFGHPLFYEYNVGYDMTTKQMSLQKGQCEPCSTEGGPMSLTDSGRRWPRVSHGEPRIPYYDVNLPL